MQETRLEKQSSILDSTQEGENLPRIPLLSSREIGWNSLHLEHHLQPPYETSEHHHAQHTIVINHSVQSLSVKISDAPHHSDHLARGNVIIMPANQYHKAAWNCETEFTVISLKPEQVTHIAYEFIDPNKVEIVPSLAKTDLLIDQIGRVLKAELESGLEDRFYTESAAMMLSAHLLRYYSSQKNILQHPAGGLSEYKLRQAIEYINQHLAENLSLQAISDHLDMSQYHFCRLFKQSMGVTFHQYIIQQRVEWAKQLLKQKTLPITDIALQCGFAHASHFAKHFRHWVGVTPQVFQKQ